MSFRTLSRAAVAIREHGEERPRVCWSPFPGPQKEAFESEADVIGYGGAGGGGKTDLALGLALYKHRRSLFFRREYPQLAGVEERSREILGGVGIYHQQKRRWTIPPQPGGPGRVLRFGAVQREKDREKWRGIPADLMVFDEAQNFLLSQVLFISTWLRTTVPGQKTRLLLCFNPPTNPEGQWLIDYFAPWLEEKHPRPAAPGELRWFVRMPDGTEQEVATGELITVEGQTLTPKSRTFFPARVQDNPVYMATGYLAQLQALPEPLRSQMLLGDFTVGIEEDAWQVLPTRWVRAAMERHREGRPPGVPLSGLGVDVACGGDDRTVLARRYGAWFDRVTTIPGKQTPDGESIAALIVTALAGTDVRPNLDVIGVGQGARTALKIAGIPCNEINFAAAAQGRDRSGKLRFANVRAEAHWMLREALDPESGESVALPEDRELLTELCAARWSLTAQGIQIERKEEMVKRLGRSPDKADAVILAWYRAASVGYGKNPWGGK